MAMFGVKSMHIRINNQVMDLSIDPSCFTVFTPSQYLIPNHPLFLVLVCSVDNQLKYAQAQLDKLKKTNVFNATFHIW